MRDNLLLHVCCGPCSVAIFEELSQEFDVTVHFCNSNIHPEEEYEKRKQEVVKLCEELNLPFVEEDYNPKEWFKKTEEFKNEPEGGKRCPVCFEMRLEKSAQYASKHAFDWLATSLTSGRNKYADIINPIGLAVAKKYGIKFFEEDWKKGRPAFASSSSKASADKKATAGKQESRQEKATRLVNEKGIYRQDYCGCTYSRPATHTTRHKKTA
ncbi:MAG: epoxyqueuosine reductase QueH [Candidatus Magasanikbacteria bacterium]